MNTRPVFMDHLFEMFREQHNPHRGEIYQVDGDMRHYHLQSQQKWRPHEMPNIDHPAKIGDMVTLNSFWSKYLGLDIGFVSGIRTFREFRNYTNGIRQIELLGLPCRWFPIGHFQEYNRGFYDSQLRFGETIYVIGT